MSDLPDGNTDLDQSTATPVSPKRSGVDTSRRLYSVVWRWHFYAGLLTAPILCIVALTGALYTFKTELADIKDHEMMFVTSLGQRRSYEDLRSVASSAAGSNEIEAVVVHTSPNRSVQFVAHVDDDAHEEEDDHGHGKHQLIHIDPYTGKVLGTQIAEDDFFAIVLQLHRSLMLGTTGRALTELTTSWGMILLATGVFLWWPRGKKNAGVWVPRIRGNLYAVLRDWHAVLGAYMTPVLVLIVGTGLVFSLVMGSAFNMTAMKIGHWPKKWFQAPQSPATVESALPVSLDKVIPKFLEHARPNDTVRFRLDGKPDTAYRAYLMIGEDKNSLRAISIDRYTGELMEVIDPPDLPFLYRVRLWAVSIHMGQIFGLPTQILALLASLVMTGLCVTGMWMWWRRRPLGRTGFPRRPEAGALPGWGWAIVLVTGVLLPVAGASFAMVALIDRLVVQRFRKEA